MVEPQPVRAYIMERDDPAGLLQLAGRILADSALDRQAWVLFRLGGATWLNEADTWPTPAPRVLRWLQRQEFPDLATYWQMTCACAEPRLFVCGATRAVWNLPPRSDLEELGLVAFVAEAVAAGSEPVWLG